MALFFLSMVAGFGVLTAPQIAEAIDFGECEFGDCAQWTCNGDFSVCICTKHEKVLCPI